MSTKNSPLRKLKFAPTIAKARLGDARVSPRKARLAIDLIRGKQVAQALDVLRFDKTKTSAMLLKLLSSAVANARENHRMNVDKLWVVKAYVDAGKSLKRYMPRARGSASLIIKRSAHMTVELAEQV